jgi:hypothetical protein
MLHQPPYQTLGLLLMATSRTRCYEAGHSLIYTSSMRMARMRWLEMRLPCQFFHEQILGSRALVAYQTGLEVGAYLLEE